MPKQVAPVPVRVLTVEERRENAIWLARHQVEYQIEETVKGLKWRMEALSRELLRAVEDLQKVPASVYNSLGVVQGRGSDIDRLSGQLFCLVEQQKQLEHLIQYGQFEPAVEPSEPVQGSEPG